MTSDIKLTQPFDIPSIKSKVKFQGDFHKELEKLIDDIESIITKKVIPNYGVQYTEYGNSSIKVKIKDKNLMCEKLIVCNFIYKANDEKFGYLSPQFTVSEKSQKTKKYDLGKFSITDNSEINKVFIEKLVDIIEEY